MTRLRWRIARWLVGPVVSIPEEDGVWIVQRMGQATVTYRAATFAMTSKVDLAPRVYGDLDATRRYNPSRRTGTFEGTLA